MSSMPRSDRNYHDYRTDMLALGTALFVMTSVQVPFLDLDTLDEDEIHGRFESHQFQSLKTLPGGDNALKSQDCSTSRKEDRAMAH